MTRKVNQLQVKDTILRDEQGQPMEHMRLFAIMAAVVCGHGAPGQRKGKAGK